MTPAAADGYVCVVDDDEDIREMLCFLLEGAGYRVEQAAEGGEALARLRKSASPCGLVLLDLMMPGMNGWELLRELRDDPALAHVPVALMSGSRVPLSALDAASTVACLTKPVELDVLLQLVARHCPAGPPDQRARHG